MGPAEDVLVIRHAKAEDIFKLRQGFDGLILCPLASDPAALMRAGSDCAHRDDMCEEEIRLRAERFRQRSARSPESLSWGLLTLNPSTCELFVEDQPFKITRPMTGFLAELLRSGGPCKFPASSQISEKTQVSNLRRRVPYLKTRLRPVYNRGYILSETPFTERAMIRRELYPLLLAGEVRPKDVFGGRSEVNAILQYEMQKGFVRRVGYGRYTAADPEHLRQWLADNPTITDLNI